MSSRPLLVLVPSRGRPESIVRLREAIDETALGEVDLLVRLDTDDPTRPRYPEHPRIEYRVGDRIGLAASWNEGALAALDDYDAMAFWGDDVVPRTEAWDRLLLEALEGRNGVAFVYARDGVWDHTIGYEIPGHPILPTHTLVGAPLIRALGWAAHPALVHYHIDTVWRELGTATDTLVFVPEVLVEHLHPLRRWSLNDATYREAARHHGGDLTAFRRWRESPSFRADCARIEAALHP